MELGATVCIPNGAPKCDVCPVRPLCLGYRRGTADLLPMKAAKKARKIEEKTVFLFLRDGKVALRKRKSDGLLAGLWEFPNVSGMLEEDLAPISVAGWDLAPKSWKKKLAAKHIFTHVEWHMTGYLLEVSGEGPEEFFWMDISELAEHAVPAAFAKYYAEAKAQLEEK